MDIYNEKLQKEIVRYKTYIKSVLPIEKQVKKLKKSGKNIGEIKQILGKNSFIFDYVPEILYHGSPESLEVINSNESTQKGSYVYATDNPVHALFFSIFRNSRIARSHIEENIDEAGNYNVKYQIDERVNGALNEIISDRNITIHVCDGKQFFKPHGETYIDREWLSKDCQSIVPIDRIQVNIKQFFDYLESQGLVDYSKYDKSKDWKTIIDMLGQNYPFGLGTALGSDIQKFDSMYDEFIMTNFPNQLEFSKRFREFSKKVMAADYKLQNPNISLEEENNYKLRYIKNFANSFLHTQKNENGVVVWVADMDKINAFLNSNDSLQIEMRRSF